MWLSDRILAYKPLVRGRNVAQFLPSMISTIVFELSALENVLLKSNFYHIWPRDEKTVRRKGIEMERDKGRGREGEGRN